MKNSVTIFRSLEPAPYFKAAAALRSARIPFQGWDSQEGSFKFPRTMHMIAVPPENETAARKVIAHIPSEIIRSSSLSASSRNDRISIWIQIFAVLFVLLLAICKFFVGK